MPKLPIITTIQPVYIVDEDNNPSQLSGIPFLFAAISPFIDIDVSYVWNQDGTPAQKIETGLGQTKTTVYTWLNGALQSKAVILT